MFSRGSVQTNFNFQGCETSSRFANSKSALYPCPTARGQGGDPAIPSPEPESPSYPLLRRPSPSRPWETHSEPGAGEILRVIFGLLVKSVSTNRVMCPLMYNVDLMELTWESFHYFVSIWNERSPFHAQYIAEGCNGNVLHSIVEYICIDFAIFFFFYRFIRNIEIFISSQRWSYRLLYTFTRLIVNSLI